ncbi:MAG: hypothetical protein OEV64_09310 [Desulfobulbaceae bacterium]|nr:hypothetical protein [Desulfobulbaceae bacterium]
MITRNIALILVSLMTVSCVNLGSYSQIESEVTKRDDGGYTLLLKGHTRHMIPITAEGFFPKQGIYRQIELIGEGTSWKHKNQPGFYYPYPEKVKCQHPNWDIGYAWVDEGKKNIYINFYWIDHPNSLKESTINGAYRIE